MPTLFIILTSLVILFQAALAAGLPWGAASMGGKFPGKYPPKMRLVAVLNIVILLLMATIVLAAGGMVLPQLKTIADVAIWVVVAFFGLSTVMNTITPSKIERIWAPVAFAQLVISVMIALG